MREKKFLVLDTETTTLNFANNYNSKQKQKIAIARPLVYDIGYVIINASGKILKKVNYLVEDVYDVPELFNTAYYSNKRETYEMLLEKGEITIEKWYNILKALESDLQDVECIAAANATFDFKKAIPFTNEFFYHKDYKGDFIKWLDVQQTIFENIVRGVKSDNKNTEYLKPVFTLFKKDYVLTDIWTIACNHFSDSVKFKKFCINNEKTTKSVQFFSTTVETIYSYYKKNAEYVESHTALDDAIVESEILSKLIKAGDFDIELSAFPFKKLGTTIKFVKEKYPKGREKIKQQLQAYITKNNGDTINNSYWIKVKKLYNEL